MGFREVCVKDMENAVKIIGDDWMLITAERSDGKVNTMTASWGFFGVLWNKPVCAVFIRPQRYTLSFVEEAERLSLTFFEETYRDALRLCGTKSGRDMDKIAESELTVLRDENGTPYFKEAKTVVVCKKLYVDFLKPECFLDRSLAEKNYPHSDYHKIFICEIERVLEKET